MDALAFLAVISCLGLVVFWYEVNARAGSDGEKGLLAITPAARETEAPSYREKKRRGPEKPSLEKSEEAAPAYRQAPERRSTFRSKGDSAYRAMGPLPRFGARPKRD